MDYSHTAGTFFPGAPPYQFMGAQVPLTPSHTNSVASDDFSANRSPPVGFPVSGHLWTRRSSDGAECAEQVKTTGKNVQKPSRLSMGGFIRPTTVKSIGIGLLACSASCLQRGRDSAFLFAVAAGSANPIAGHEAYTIMTQEIFDQYPNVLPTDQFQNFDNNYVHQYNTAQAFPGPPTPPGQIPGQIPGSIGVHPVTAAATAAVAPAAVPAVTSAIHQPGHASDLLHVPKPDPEEQQSQQQLQQQQQQQSRRQGSSEEEDPNPAQSRRKAQNRAAYVESSCMLGIVP
jgi:hypothetical protein